MRYTDSIAGAIDRLNEGVGRVVSLLTVGTVLITFAVAVLRYGFSTGWVWLQESYVWINAFVVLAGAGYTLRHDGHVRCDFLYGTASPAGKAWVDLLGTLFFLFPTCGLVAWTASGYVAMAWERLEGSGQAGGLPGLFLLKTMIPVFCVLMALQGLATALRSASVIAEARARRRASGGRGAAAEAMPQHLPHRLQRRA
ncbi:TRAP transporter small permease subunit [Azospirillum sp. ST 5-10]|uniref:TRAP transporter small permease subunit n=1 Tax=unclassified Azospirillum TaxID=2630922 RepID=UPI003F4A7A1D